MAPIAKLFVEIGSNITGFQRGMKQVDNQIKDTAKSASILTNALGTGLGIVAAQATTKLVDMGKAAINTGINFNSLVENSTMAFETMLGGLDKATGFLEQLKKFARDTPFELEGLIPTAQKLKAFGFETEKILPMLTAIGDATAGLGGSPELLNRITIALGQIRAKGKVQAQEMMQLTEAGIPAWEILAKKIGVTIPEVMKLSERGAIQAGTAIEGILEGLTERFGGLMEKQAKTFSGMKAAISDITTQLTGRLVKPWFDKAKIGMESLIKLFDSEKFNRFFDRVVKGSEFAANAVGNLFTTIKGMFSGNFSGFTSIFKFLDKYKNTRFAFLSNFTLDDTKNSIVGFINDLKNGGKYLDYWFGHMPTIIKPVMKLVQKFYEYFAGGGIQSTLKRLGSIFTNLGTIMLKLVRPFKDALGGLFNQLSTMRNIGFSDIFAALINAAKSAFTGLIDVIKSDFWPSIKSGLVWIWNAISSWVTETDWVGVWNAIVSGIQSIADWVMNIDWANVWSYIFTGLTAIWDFFTTYVFPVFGAFFEWLVSWFTDTEKNNQLLAAISSVWTFITTWVGYFIDWVSPYLSSFFGWLISWFTDETKRARLLEAISNTWTFVTEWAKAIWDWVSPVLATGFNWLLSWFTDSQKRSQLWNGIVATWDFLTSWAKAIWDWISPYLVAGWKWLTSWFTDTEKNKQLKNGIYTGWTALTDWASALWGWIYPHLASMYSSLKLWIDTNYPNFGSWIDEVVKFTTDAGKQFKDNFPSMQQSVIDLRQTIIEETPLIAAAFARLYNAFTGGDGTGNTFVNQITWFFNTITSAIGNIIKQTRILIDILAIMVEATKAVFSGDFDTYWRLGNEFTQRWQEFMNSVQDQWNQFNQPFNNPPVINSSSVSRSLLDDNTNVMASSNALDVYIHNEGTNPISREAIDQISQALARELRLGGNRVTYAGGY